MLQLRTPAGDDLGRDPAADELAEARAVLNTEADALRVVADRLDDRFPRAVAALAKCQGSVITTGIGKAGLVARKVAATLSSTGAPSHFLHPAEAVHGDLGGVTERDAVLAFSHSGESIELTQILPALKRQCGAVVAVTGRSSGALAKAADVALVYGAVVEACPIGMAPSTSTTVMMALGDALAFGLMRRRSFSENEFGRFHPAGSLGRRMRNVEEVMRAGDELRLAKEAMTIREVLMTVQRPGRRTGAVMLVDAHGRLAGLFTDSDLARLLEKG
ncbi:MAG: KpsF/GutQ family sugar-phosphate isomerase, partial [Planctomycetia bacterium]